MTAVQSSRSSGRPSTARSATAELDYRTGKLSESDYEATDSQLRAEALVILNQLESLGSTTAGEPSPAEAGESGS